jgi:hypothetical protein
MDPRAIINFYDYYFPQKDKQESNLLFPSDKNKYHFFASMLRSKKLENSNSNLQKPNLSKNPNNNLRQKITPFQFQTKPLYQYDRPTEIKLNNFFESEKNSVTTPELGGDVSLDNQGDFSHKDGFGDGSIKSGNTKDGVAPKILGSSLLRSGSGHLGKKKGQALWQPKVRFFFCLFVIR